MNHNEKVLGEILGSLFAPSGQSNNENEDESCEGTTAQANTDSPTNSFIEDVCQFFNINQNDSNEGDKDDSSTEDSDEQVKDQSSGSTPKSELSWNMAEEIKKIRSEFPTNDENCAGLLSDALPLSDLPSTSKKSSIIQKEPSADFNQSPENNAFLKEVKRVLYEVKPSYFPENKRQKYFDVAQNYAVYGEGFLDFPQDLNAICREVRPDKELMFEPEFHSSSSDDELVQPRDYPYHPPVIDPRYILKSAEAKNFPTDSNRNFSEHSMQDFQNLNNPNNMRPPFQERQARNNSQLSLAAATSAATAATYYQLCTNLQPSLRPVAVVNASTSAAASSAASPGYVLLSNRVTYLARGTHNFPPQQVFFNQQQMSTTTNFFANQAAIGAPPNIRFPNPVVATTTTTQHISKTVYKETQYVANVPVANAGGRPNVNTYERLVNAQLVRQVLQTRQQQQQQQQQQALIAAAIYQQRFQRQQHQIRMANSLQNTVMNSVSSTMNTNVNANIVDRNIGNVVGQTGSVETTCTMLQMQSVDVARVNFNSDPGSMNFSDPNNNNFKPPHQG